MPQEERGQAGRRPLSLPDWNMVLLRTGGNFKIGSKSFAEKFEVFKASGFELARNTSEKSDWTP